MALIQMKWGWKSMNELIELIFENFTVDGVKIPVIFMYYRGHGEPYVIYMKEYSDNALRGDDSLVGYVDYYDFDVYSKGNFTNIIEQVRTLLEEHGFVWRPDRSSTDMFDPDTGYYHRTLNFSFIREESE